MAVFIHLDAGAMLYQFDLSEELGTRDENSHREIHTYLTAPQ